MNTTTIPMIGAILLGLAAAIAFAFPVSAQEAVAIVDAGVSLDAGTSDMVVEGSATTSADVDLTGEPLKVETSGSITIMRSSLTADAGTAPMSSASVSSDADLSAYATAAIKADENIDSVSFSDDGVEVSYYEEGRFIGMFPVTMKARATVAADGTVTVAYPWYRFLVAIDSDADVRAAVEARVKAWRAAHADATLNASAKAALMDEIRGALATHASAEVR